MRNTLIALILGLCASVAMAADEVPAHPYIKLETTEGNIVLELDGKQAPLTVGHVLKLVDSGFYDGLIFHRVIPGFMAQSGGFTPGFKLKENDDTIPNESGNGLSNLRGTIAMARTQATRIRPIRSSLSTSATRTFASTQIRTRSAGAGATLYSVTSSKEWKWSTKLSRYRPDHRDHLVRTSRWFRSSSRKCPATRSSRRNDDTLYFRLAPRGRST